MYLIPVLNTIAYLSDRNLWAAKLDPYFAEEKDAQLAHKDRKPPQYL